MVESMKSSLATLLVILAMSAGAFAAGKGPEIDLVDNKLSINVETIQLGRLLGLLDLATGMQSKVPAELANRNISVKFSGLSLEDGVRKIFQGQPLDYVVVEGRGVIVTSASQTSPVGGTPTPTPFGTPNPFGTPSPFGASQNNQNNLNMFGAPTVFGVPGATQPRP